MRWWIGDYYDELGPRLKLSVCSSFLPIVSSRFLFQPTCAARFVGGPLAWTCLPFNTNTALLVYTRGYGGQGCPRDSIQFPKASFAERPPPAPLLP